MLTPYTMQADIMPEETEDAKARLGMAAGARKAQYDMLSRNMVKNREATRKAKEENKSMQKKLKSLKMGNMGGVQDPITDVLRKTEKKVMMLKKEYDRTCHGTKARQQRVDEMRDSLKQIDLQAPGPEDEEAMTRQIRPLENRLDKAMIKYNEAQNIRRTYEQIVKRLREERTGFDSHLKSLEDTMKGKEKDHEDLEILARDAVAARDASRAELETLRVEYEEFVRWTEDQLNEQRAKVRAREEMEQKMQAREKSRNDAALQAKGELDEAGENMLRQHYVAAVLGKAAAKRETHSEEDRVNTYESAFRRIKEATGVSDVSEIIQKFLTQEDTLNRLNDLAKESQARIEQLTEERKRIQQKVVDAKMKSSSTAGNRRIVDEFEQLLSEAKVKSERIRTKYERLTKVMINVKAGIDHLGDKIHMALGRAASPRVSTSNGPVIDSLKQCQKRLAIMLDVVREKSGGDDLGRSDDQPSFFAGPPEGTLELGADNIRIPLGPEVEAGEDDDEEEGFDDDVLDRRTLKRSSQLLVDKQTRKPRRKKRHED